MFGRNGLLFTLLATFKIVVFIDFQHFGSRSILTSRGSLLQGVVVVEEELLSITRVRKLDESVVAVLGQVSVVYGADRIISKDRQVVGIRVITKTILMATFVEGGPCIGRYKPDASVLVNHHD